MIGIGLWKTRISIREPLGQLRWTAVQTFKRDLSGGQWQKVAISRSFMRDAEVAALDEPTAALDPKAEADVFRRFMKMAGGKTALLVSHRLGLARYCDRIFVMKDGALPELGTHEELTSK